MRAAADRVPMRVLAYVLMPNHWHLVLWPEHDGAISAYIKWLAGTHACHFNTRYRHSGAVYQSRFKSVPIRSEVQLLQAVRYVEANPVRAGLVPRAERWDWSSAAPSPAVALAASPVPRPSQWLDLLADPSVDLIQTVLGESRQESVAAATP